MLEPFADGVWTVTQPQRFFGIEVGTRMTVVQLSDGGLFIHCPTRLDDATRRAVDAIGPVRVVAATSLFHHLHAKDWADVYRDALLCGCPGLDRKRPDLPWGHVLGDEPDDRWADDLSQVWFSARFEKEVVFFHRASKTLMCADALLNLSRHPSAATRFVAFAIGNRGPGEGSLERWFAVRDRRACRDQVERMLSWDIERIALAHGGLIEREGRAVLREAYDWVLGRR